MCLSGVAGTITLCVVVHELRLLVKEIKMTFYFISLLNYIVGDTKNYFVR